MVSLILNIIHFHHQTQFFGNLSCATQSGLLILDGLGPTLNVNHFGTTEKFLDTLSIDINAFLAHLDTACFSCKTYYSNIMTWHTFHRNNITFCYRQAIRKTEKLLTVVFETDLNKVKQALARRMNATHPIARSDLTTTT